jgi:hypothetical protein
MNHFNLKLLEVSSSDGEGGLAHEARNAGHEAHCEQSSTKYRNFHLQTFQYLRREHPKERIVKFSKDYFHIMACSLITTFNAPFFVFHLICSSVVFEDYGYEKK